MCLRLGSLIPEHIFVVSSTLSLTHFRTPTRSFSSPRLSNFISVFGTSKLTAFFIPDSSTSRSNSLSCSSSSSSPTPSSVSESLSFALSFQNQVADSPPVSLVSVVPSLSSSLSSYTLRTELISLFKKPGRRQPLPISAG